MSNGAHVSRRGFLSGSAASLGILPHLPLTDVASLADPQKRGHRGQEAWVHQARRQIPAATQSAYFQTGGIGPSPASVMDQVAERLRLQNRGPADPRFSAPMATVEPDLRAHLAAVFDVSPNGVALTHSTSEGISIAAWSRNWDEGDEVILSNQEHPANVVPWYILRDRFGIVLREINLDAGTQLLEEVRGALTPNTRMVSISHVSRNNGRRIRTEESAELGNLLRQRDVLYHLDGAQGPGCVPFSFAELGADCYSTCGHKWLLGPKGTGAFFVRDAQLDRIQMSWAGSHSHADMDYAGSYTLLPSAARYEFGTRALADFAGFETAVSWMEGFGLDRIHSRIQDLVEYAIEKTRASNKFEVSSPESRQDRSGVFVLRLPAGCDAGMVYERLSADRNILSSPVRVERDLRLAIHFFNLEDEIDAAFEALEALC